MRHIHKNPIFYYIVAPVLIGLWPLLVWAVYLPSANDAQAADKGSLDQAQTAILDILKFDPDRLEIKGGDQGKFTYAEAIDSAANLCRIPSANYSNSAGGIAKSGGKEVRGAHVSLDNIAVIQLARFLSELETRWVNLTCEKVTLKKKEGMPDQWGVDLDFKYTY